MNTVSDNLSFKAKLDTRKLKGDPARLRNISKEFEILTQKYAKDKFVLSSDEKCVRFSVKDKRWNYGWIENDFFDRLMQLEDSRIAKKLANLFIMQRKIVEMDNLIMRYRRKYIWNKSNIMGGVNGPSDYLDEAKRYCEIAQIERLLKRDKMLYNNRQFLNIHGYGGDEFFWQG